MEIFERQMMVTVEACEETDLKIALEFLPADHVALASDWPHYDGTPDLLAGFRKASAGLGRRGRPDGRDRDARALVPVALGARDARRSAEHHHAAVDHQHLTGHHVGVLATRGTRRCPSGPRARAACAAR